MDAVGLGGLPRWNCVAPQDVLPRSHYFEMPGVHAPPNSAEMIEHHRLGHRPYVHLEGEPMSEASPASGQPELTVPVMIDRRRPEPTAIRTVALYLCEESLEHRQPTGCSERVAVAMPAQVVAIAPSPGENPSAASLNGTGLLHCRRVYEQG